MTAPGKQETPARIRCNIAICGAGVSWLEETIPPLGSTSFTLKARLEASAWGDLSYSLGTGAFTLQAPEGPVHRLRVGHETRQAPLELEPGARPWVGAVVSNEVELKIVP